MAFNVTFYTGFGKRKNSTKQPSDGGVDYSCVLKAPSSVICPVIEIAYDSNSTFQNFTYAYIPAFGRYYFVTDIRYVNRVWEIALEVDVLASYRSNIRNSTKYVLRSQSSSDISIVDDVRQTQQHVTTATRVAACPWVNIGLLASGTYVVGVIGNGGTTGCVQHYVMNYATLVSFMNKVFDITMFNLEAEDTSVMSEQLLKAFINPSQYIVSIMWFPVEVPTGGSGQVKLGWWNTGVSAPLLAAKTRNYARVQINGTSHPQAGGSKSHYLNSAPYTTRSLFLPVFGEVPVDTARGSFQQFYIDTCVDFLTGAAQADISGSGNDSTETAAYIARVNGQMGVQLPVAQTIQNGGGMLDALTSRQLMTSGVVGGASTAISGTMPSGAPNNRGEVGVSSIGNGLSQVGSSLITGKMASLHGINASVPTAHSSGAFGSFLEVQSNQGTVAKNVLLSETFVKVSEAAPADCGLPLARNVSLSSLSGFVLCANGNVEIGGTKLEKDAIEVYLTTGVYLE